MKTLIKISLLIVFIMILTGCGQVLNETSGSGSSSGGGNPPANSYTLTIVVSPNLSGAVTTSPNATTFTSGTTVNLTATPAGGYMFSNWSGDLTGASNISCIGMNSDKTITAEFTAIPAGVTYPLNISVVGTGCTVSKTPNLSDFNAGDTVLLQANTVSGWVFDSWSGAINGSTNPTSLNMNATKNITATFKQLFTLTSVVSPNGAGHIYINGYDSTLPIASTYIDGTSIAVQSNANAGYEFDHWENNLSGTLASQSLLMNGNKTITAVYKYWQSVGSTSISSGAVRETVASYIYDGIPYIAYIADGGNEITVKKYTSGSWQTIGSSFCTNYKYDGSVDNTADTISLYVYNAGGTPVPYVAYGGGWTLTSIQANVMKYDGTAWVKVGGSNYWEGASLGNSASFPSLAIANDGTPYVAYRDGVSSNKLTVTKFNGTAWETVGAHGISSGSVQSISLCIASDGIPYVSYCGDSSAPGYVTVQSYSSGWSILGGSAISGANEGAATSIVADGTTIYVVYGKYGSASVVKEYSGSWSTLGAFSNNQYTSYSNRSIIVSGGAPFIIYYDSNNSDKISLAKYSAGTWSDIGGNGVITVASSGGYWASLAVSSEAPYIAYADGSNKACVKKFDLP